MALVFGSIFAAMYSNAVNTPNKGSSAQQVFVISSGQGLEKIANNLHDQKLVSNVFVFELYMKAAGLSGKVQAGEYKIAGNLNMKNLAQLITLGKITTNKITIPEGWTNVQIGNYLESNTTITKAQFLAAAKYDPTRDSYSWLSGMSSGQSLEGFLYPDTYQISLHPTADEVVKKMLANFDKKLTPAMRAQIKTSGMNTYEVVTLASVVEKEAVKTADRKLVAGVFEKRLSLGMPLQSDVTVLYAEGREKGEVSYLDTQVNSPYNTYKVAGLPAGPVCNPSIESIQSVLSPTKSNYLYFLAAPDGTVYYAATVDQHNSNKAKYLK